MASRLFDEPGALLGFWCQTAHPTVVDAAASAGPRWICIDTQHGAALDSLDSSLFTVIASYGVASLVRVAGISAEAIGRALDLGADGVVVPLVEDPADVEMAVAAAEYAPAGLRSFGMQTKRVGPFDRSPLVVIQVETAGAVENLEAIAAVPGLGGLYIGPADLGLALAGRAASDVEGIFDGRHPEVLDACRRVVAVSDEVGIIAGIHCDSGAQAKLAARAGFRMMAVASDIGSVLSNLSAQLDSGGA